jgi:hypothetical protein
MASTSSLAPLKNEDHVVAVPPNAPEDQDDGSPKILLSRLGTGPGSPPQQDLSVG